jgi:DNA-binding response OmpR family regulator
LSGDYGFGAQATLEDIVAATYGALGILGPDIESAFSRSQSVPWAEDRPRLESDTHEVVLIDEDQVQRSRLAEALLERFADKRVHQFSSPGEALAAFRDRDPDLVLTELEFTGGASAQDVIDRFRGVGGDRSVALIVSSARDRREIGVEALARQEVLFLAKPVNLGFAVGMIGGCLTGSQRTAPTRRLTLSTGDALFRQGEPGTTVYVVQSGELSILKSDGRREVELRRAVEGDILGEMALFGDSVRTASAVATQETTLLAVHIDNAREYLDREPVWLRSIVESLARRVLDNDAAALAAVDGGYDPVH